MNEPHLELRTHDDAMQQELEDLENKILTNIIAPGCPLSITIKNQTRSHQSHSQHSPTIEKGLVQGNERRHKPQLQNYQRHLQVPIKNQVQPHGRRFSQTVFVHLTSNEKTQSIRS